MPVSTPDLKRNGLLTAVVLPFVGTLALVVLLFLWAQRLDAFVRLPVYGAPVQDVAFTAAGLLLLLASLIARYRVDGDINTNPTRAHGIYRIIRFPMSLGGFFLAIGLSFTLRSDAGLWIVTPLVGLGCIAWVLGFELKRTYTGTPPLLHFPGDIDAPLTFTGRISAYALLFLPWLFLYGSVESMGVPPDPIMGVTAIDSRIPLVPWTEIPYIFTYPFVLAVPFVARTQRELNWFMKRGWIAILTVVPFYYLVPIIAPAKPTNHIGGIYGMLMAAERIYDEPVTACPSFHVIWSVLTAKVFVWRWPRLKLFWWFTALLISVSCVTTGMHAVLDIFAGFSVAGLLVNADLIWDRIRRVAARVEAWERETTLGPVHLSTSGLQTAVAAWIGLYAATTLAGVDRLPLILFVSVACITGAALWTGLTAGSLSPLKPFSWFGSIIGGVLALLAASFVGYPFWRFLAALAIGGALTQAFGRRKFLPSGAWLLFVVAVLLRCWALGAGYSFIAGLYFILAGLGRFVEEHYRVDPVVPALGGLKKYQWFSMAVALLGAILTCLPSAPAGGVVLPGGRALATITAFSIVTLLAYGVSPAVSFFRRIRIR